MTEQKYWIVAGTETKAWSSDTNAYVPASDQNYVAWLGAGKFPTRIASEQELCDVINKPIVDLIETLELKQARPLRELSLGIAPGDGAPSHEARLAALDAEISALRASLLKAPL